MANENINIVFTMTDELSKALSNVSKNVEALGKQMDQVGRSMSKAGSQMVMVGGAITGAFALALRQVSEFSPEARRVFDDIADSALELNTAIVTAVLPVFQAVSGALNSVVTWFNSLDVSLRNNILQGVLIGGIFLTIGGVMLKLIGIITSLGGKFIQFLNPVGLVLIAITGGLILMIQNWETVRGVVLPIVKSVENAVLMLAIGYDKTAIALGHLLAFMASMAGQQSSAVYWESEVVALEQQIKELEQRMSEVMSDVGPTWASNLDDGVMKIKQKVDEIKQYLSDLGNNTRTEVDKNLTDFKKVIDGYITSLQTLGKQAGQLVVTQVNMFATKFGQSVSKMIMEGKNFGESMKQMFFEMAEAFIAEVARMIAQWLAFMALKKAVSFFGIFHEGGQVMHNGGPVRAHSGLSLASDEVPIIAQRGEGILSRRGMMALGGTPALNALNSGRSMRGDTYISIEVNGPVVRNDMDIKTLTEEISNRLAREAERIY